MLRYVLAATLCLASIFAFATDDQKSGQLENGLHYVIEHNANPAGKVELRLVVKTGSRDELDDERGIAHLVEHMAFRRTTHFGEGEINRFLNSQGMRWGNDSNAWTSWEDTTYMLSTGKDGLQQGVQLMADWAGGVTFHAVDLALERRIVQDEMRLRSADTRLLMDWSDAIYPEREYSNRMPIGEEASINGLPLDRVAAFYRRNYVAPRMTMIVVGDIEPAQVEELVRAQFAGVAAGPLPAPWPVAVPQKGTALFTNDQARALQRSQVGWYWIEYWDGIATEAGMQRDWQHQLLLVLLQRRLQSQTFASFDNPRWMSDNNVSHAQLRGLQVDPKPGQTLAALEALRTEIERARRIGFSSEEVAEAQRVLTGLLETQVRQPQQQAARAQALAASAGSGVVADTPAQSLARFKRYLPLLDAEREKQLLDATLMHAAQLVTALHSVDDAAADFGVVTDSDISAIENRVRIATLAGGHRQLKAAKLMAVLPEPGHIVKTDLLPGGGIWTLGNGMQVRWQAPRNSNEMIGIAAIGIGGLDALPKDLRLAGAALSGYDVRVGAGKLTRLQLDDVLVTTSVSLVLNVNTDTHGYQGNTAPAELETALQLLNLHMQPLPEDTGARYAAVGNVANKMQLRVDHADMQAFGENWPWRNWEESDLKALTTRQIADAQRALFGNPAAIRVTLTGVADPAIVAPLVARYLGSLTADTARPALLPVKASPATGAHVASYGSDSEARFNWRFVQPQAVDAVASWQAGALADIMQQRLLSALRFDSGHAYTLLAGDDVSQQRGMVLSVFHTGPVSQCRTLATRVLGEMQRLQQEGVTEAEVIAARQRMHRSVADAQQEPGAYARMLAFQWRYMPERSAPWPDFDQIITQDSMQAAARRWLGIDGSYLATRGCEKFWGDDGLKGLLAGK
ncbi:putative zinc protease [Andreprevotia sp. IGB-42]|uniref:M16 family metallopeptidase n=1 Tax=Andreprevotia sp. IGB-42 TaxID=2497473 RepID=UPI001359AD7F|nr:insulinase family protein [Andreprevotia sp. IGB-42]KAF0814356.1 putative zinc protease [Andreprevotia sp. IGB-42]